MIIKIVTISLMAVFYICYFAKLISQKKQGIKTDQLGKGKEGFVKFIEVALKIITYLLPVIQIISIVFYSGTAHIVLQFTGVVITMFGVLAFIVSVTQMKENWRAGVQKEEKTSLVTTGIYSISRNPAFLGFDLMYIGILFSFFNWFLCFATGFAVVFFHLQIVNVICLITSVFYGIRNGFNFWYILIVAIMFAPSIFIFYNSSAWVYVVGYAVIALLGNLIALPLGKR